MSQLFSESLHSNFEIDLNETSGLKESHIKILLEQYKEIAITKVIQEFGLSPFIDDYKRGGNVTTLHNANAGVFLDDDLKEQYSRDYSKKTRQDIYEKDFKKMRKHEFKQNQTLVDDYTGKELQKDGSSHRDHIVSASEIHKNNEARLYMSDDERGKMAVDEQNLAWANDRLNKSKGDKDLKVWMDSPNPKDSSQTNLDRYEIDEAAATKKYVEAKKHVNSSVTKAKNTYYVKKMAKTGLDQGVRVGFKQAVGLFFYELQHSLFKEIKVFYKNFKQYTDWESRTVAFKQMLERVFVHMTQNVKRFATTFKDGFIGGFMGNLLTVFINTFMTTSKKLARLINDGVTGLWSAFKLLTNPPQGMDSKTAMKEATKLVVAALATTAGVLLTESFVTYLQTTPFAMFAHLIGGLIGGILTGIVVATLMYAIDELVASLYKLNELMDTFKESLYTNTEQVKATYEAAIAMMNVEYQAVLQTIFRQYEEYRQLSAIAFDENERVSVRLDASVELADLLDVPTDNVMRNADDVRNFLRN
ncbi:MULTISPECIES: hypothetical protein [unclassified Exiguobacterium]|uniref:hypothetical protein n=1 Tax=unclassified Exiguobacterium TaxID=2644629 RepID=UPI0010391FD9|nr:MULTISPECIES: hypothetical protein [unclassified Exiguobacterium]TCI39062.1 hypothetical protein EVJ29_00025 [Exiguobacterium sp. SH4S7]TCI48249.1 hypothetical protein EVJ31_04210 [Exiguobacterium sp. SH5S32]TCI55135.1 hypothetical protein EVJ25_04200 [Exiguobacterium sp. SH1S4]TCI74929.1 hypothetical protein EVJ23_04200 [Exiguobacterium sp. SH1S1]